MTKHNFSFSQGMLSMMSDINASTISRLATKLGFKTTGSNFRKKYNFEEGRKILTEFVANHYKINKQVQVFFNFKGGTGKTSLCHQMSAHMALLGFKVLAIDCDPQMHLTYVLGAGEDEERKSLYDVIVNNFPVEETIMNIYPGLDLLPSDLLLTTLELRLNQEEDKEKTLQMVIEPLKKQYDFIFLDTNPTISILNQNATYCSDLLNIVCETHPFSFDSLKVLIGQLNEFSEQMEKEINYKIIPNKYETKTATSQDVLGGLRHYYKDDVLESIVRKSEDMNISAKRKEPIFAFCKKNSHAFEDMCDLSLSILKESATDLNKIRIK